MISVTLVLLPPVGLDERCSSVLRSTEDMQLLAAHGASVQVLGVPAGTVMSSGSANGSANLPRNENRPMPVACAAWAVMTTLSAITAS